MDLSDEWFSRRIAELNAELNAKRDERERVRAKHGFGEIFSESLSRRDLIAIFHLRGVSLEDIAIMLDVGVQSVQNNLRARNLRQRIAAKKQSEIFLDQVAGKWADIVPDGVAIRQARWEFGRRIRNARDIGTPLDEIAAHFGVSYQTIVKRMNGAEGKSPVERYLAAPILNAAA